MNGISAALLSVGTAVFIAAMPAAAETLGVPGGTGNLVSAIAAAHRGDVLRLAAGVYDGPIVVDRPGVTLEGEPGVILDGHGQGTVLRIVAADVTVRGVTVRNSGIRQEEIDSGIYADVGGDRALIEGNILEENLFGISLRGAENAVARNNKVSGLQRLQVNDRGDGISVWKSRGSRAEYNDVRWGRDGIRSTASRDNIYTGNRFAGVRYAVHYMWTNGGTVEGNHSAGNDIGFAIMYSRDVTVRHNVSSGDLEYGLLLNSSHRSTFEGNIARGSRGKCLFLYDANENRILDNRFEGCEIGIHFTAGAEHNAFSGNAFIANQTQVMYVGTRTLNWSDKGRGNYWSDNPAFDLNGDGIADMPYRPNDIIDRVIWSVPLAKLLLGSPAVQVVRWAQAEFPAVTPGGVFDPAPLMAPPAVSAEVTQ